MRLLFSSLDPVTSDGDNAGSGALSTKSKSNQVFISGLEDCSSPVPSIDRCDEGILSCSVA